MFELSVSFLLIYCTALFPCRQSFQDGYYIVAVHLPVQSHCNSVFSKRQAEYRCRLGPAVVLWVSSVLHTQDQSQCQHSLITGELDEGSRTAVLCLSAWVRFHSRQAGYWAQQYPPASESSSGRRWGLTTHETEWRTTTRWQEGTQLQTIQEFFTASFRVLWKRPFWLDTRAQHCFVKDIHIPSMDPRFKFSFCQEIWH